jgi:eukaryotic-like serine/threonine-protein kinase
MELQHLGRYQLVAPFVVDPSDGGRRTSRFFVARHEDEADGGPPTYLVKLHEPGRGAEGDARRARFEHESRLLRAFNHPSIPMVHAAGEQDGVPYIVMDRVDGIDLGKLCGHEGIARPLAKEVAVYVLAQIVDAVRHIHELEVDDAEGTGSLAAVHRDICPANVICSRSGDVVLCDFGSARSRWLAREHDDPRAGALAYQAPERLTDGAADARTDLFALAVMLWELLRGQRCLAGADDNATRENIARFDIGQPARRVPGLSPKLGEVLRRNLDRDPSRRYEDAYQMLQRLAQAPEAQAAEQSRQALAELVGTFSGR